MLGYHYTSWKNWLCIQSVGLRPQWVIEEHVRAESKDTKGIWAYKSYLEKQELLGMLLTIMGSKRCSCVCELELKFSDLDCIQALNSVNNLQFTCSATVGDWKFVRDKPTVIIRNTIPTNLVKLRRVWCLDQVSDIGHLEDRFSFEYERAD